MFLLKKIFKLRNHSGGQYADKPFLEHLEDLRDLIARIIITLIITTILCYVFKGSLLDILRRPIEQVWQKSEQTKLPEDINSQVWEQAKQIADGSAHLTPRQKQYFHTQFVEEKVQYYAECAGYYRAALTLKDANQQKQFIEQLPELSEQKKTTILNLLEKGPSSVVNARNDMVNMSALRPTETFMLAIKLSLFAGIVISFPLLLYFCLQFIVPGLKPKERKALFPALLIGFGLFLGGVFFCYYIVLPRALDFFFQFGNNMGVQNEWRIGEYISFTTQFTLIFGLSFELPVIIMTLVKIDLLSYETMRNTRSYAIISILAIAAIITPTGDAFTLLMLGIPMIILYEICIWLAYFRRKKESIEEEREREKIEAYLSMSKTHDDEQDDHEYDHHIPRIAPVPGKVPTNSEEELIFDEDEGEGDELDDGIVEPCDEAEVYTEGDEQSNTPTNHDSSDQTIPDPSDEIDFNPGSSFEDQYSPEETNPDNPTDKP